MLDNNNKRKLDTSSSSSPYSNYDNKFFKMDSSAENGKFLIIKRTDPDATMATISPFVLSKGIEGLLGGKPREIRKLRDGTVLLRIMTKKQADKILKKKELVQGINISVSEHEKLNISKGVVTLFDLKNASETETLTELGPQGVIAMKRLKRKNKQGEMEDSDSYLFTFKGTSAPDFIRIGFYERVRVRPFIPQPLRCFVCQKFGYTAKTCSFKPICKNCPELKTEDHKVCARIVCTNCYSVEHASWDKSCPKYKEELEIQCIKTRFKVAYNDARKQYLAERPPMEMNFADVVKNNLARNNLEPVKFIKKEIAEDTDVVMETANINQGKPRNSV